MLSLLKAQLGEPSLENLMFFFVENPALKSPKPAPKRAKLKRLITLRGHAGVWGGGAFCCSVPQHGRVQGRAEGHTHTHTHTHTQEHTHTHTHTHTEEHEQERRRECCTYPLATYPSKVSEECKNRVLIRYHSCQNLYTQKSLGVHKILVRKIWFPPPPEKGPK